MLPQSVLRDQILAFLTEIVKKMNVPFDFIILTIGESLRQIWLSGVWLLMKVSAPCGFCTSLFDQGEVTGRRFNLARPYAIFERSRVKG